MQSQSANIALIKIISTLTLNREYLISNKTPFNGTNFYKTKNVLLTRQYVITNVKYVKQNCILYQF